MTPPADEQQTRAVVLAIWKPLKTGEWGPYVTRDLDDHGDRPAYRSIATGSVPRAPSMDATITTRVRLAIIATTTEATPRTVLLTEPAYQRALELMARDEFIAHQHSLTGERLAPYRWSTSRSVPYLRERESGWDAHWSRYARAALARIVGFTITWPAGEDAPQAVAS